jgi:hypothetical protein
LEATKAKLHTYYIQHYANNATTSRKSISNATQSVTSDGSPSKVNFTSRYKKKDNVLHDELEEYFKLPREDFDACKPLEWWLGQRPQFPNLYGLARDLFSIPGRSFLVVLVPILPHLILPSVLGSAVAVERIFSGGQDTISLRRASLQPETIRMLMVLKQRLRLARAAISKAVVK